MTAAAQVTSTPADATFAQPCVSERRTIADDAVGTLSDNEREEAIKRAGRALEAHYFHWCCTGSFAAKGDADRARLLMEALIAGRSKAQVRRMEIKKGLI